MNGDERVPAHEHEEEMVARWATVSPEEFVARHGHEFGMFSLHKRRFSDPRLQEWVEHFVELTSSPVERLRCRAEFLTPEELDRIRAEEEWEAEHGFLARCQRETQREAQRKDSPPGDRHHVSLRV